MNTTKKINKQPYNILCILKYGIDEKNGKLKNTANYINRNLSSERHFCK